MPVAVYENKMVKLIQIPLPSSAIEIRRCMVANAISTIGLEAGKPSTRYEFEELLGPTPRGFRWDLDRPFRSWMENGRAKSQGISTCAMISLGILRRMQVSDADIMDGYWDDIGSGLDTLEKFARKCGALQKPEHGLRPNPGAIVKLDAPMHALTAIRWSDDYGSLISADGGQVGAKNLQAVKQMVRTWYGGKVPRLGNRPILWWVEVDLLSYSGKEIAVPEWYESIDV